jgi:hypothetical protein
MNHQLADNILRAYLAERRHRRNGFPRCSSGFGSARHVSKCHGAPTIESRRGERLCAVCRQPCDLKHLEMRSAPVCLTERWPDPVTGEQRIEIQTIAVHETRQIDRDGEDRKNVSALWRWVALSRMIEPRPRDMPLARWEFDLVAWWLVLDHGIAQAVRIGTTSRQRLGKWTEWSVRTAVEEGREIVNRRAARERGLVQELVA